MSEIEIIEAVDIFSAEPARIGKKDSLVTYTVDKTRTYMITLPAEEATEERITEEIRKAEEARGRIIGKKFEV